MARLFSPSRALMVLVVLVALAAAIIVLSSGAGPAKSCVGRSHITTGLTGSLSAVTGSSASLTTLPPSHDNDAGRSRIPDATPDADNDTARSRAVCATK